MGFVTEGIIEHVTWSLELNDAKDLAGGGSEGRVLSRGRGRCKRRDTEAGLTERIGGLLVEQSDQGRIGIGSGVGGHTVARCVHLL